MASRPTRIGAVLGSLAVATVLTTTAPASAEDTGSGPDDTSRAEALHNVETTIVELGTIFTQLAEMVHAQGEMAQRIDENVDEALGNVDAAKAQLMRYLATVSTNRWLVMKVFGVLLAFILFFVLFVA